MKRFILIVFLFIFTANLSFAEETDYRQLYLDMEVPSFSYVHNIDPGQYYDYKDAAYSIYPLFRLSTTLYFKTIKIPSGYYHLTPVTHKGDNYILFKDNGVVKFIIPVYKKELVPEGFYESHIPQPKLNWKQRQSKRWYAFLAKHFKRAQRKLPVQSYLEVNELDNKFVAVIIYYGPYRYYTLFRTVIM